MIRILLMTLWLGFIYVAEAQIPSNPFDLHYRNHEQKSTIRSTPPKSVIDSSVSKSQESGIDKIKSPIQEKEYKADTSSLPKASSDSVSSIPNSNPFENGEILTADST